MNLNMPINVFGNSNSDNKNGTSLFLQKHYLRTISIEANFEEDIDLINQYKIKNLPDPTSIQDACSKNYVDNSFNDSSIIKNTAHIVPKVRSITNARFIQVNQLPQIDSHLTAKLYVDNAISDGLNEQLLLRLDPDEKLTQGSIILNSTLSTPKTVIELPTKHYVDNNFDDPSIIKNSDHVDFKDKYLDSVRWIRVNEMPVAPNDLVTKLYVTNALSDILGYVNGLHEINRNKRDLSSMFSDFDKNNYKIK